MSKFQIITVAIFVLCILAGVALFATYKGKNQTVALPPVTIWGTFPQDTLDALVTQVNTTRPNALSITYVQKSAATFNQDFIEALARGQGPDAILIPHTMLLRHEDKIIPIPSTILTERDFKNTYVQEAELYLTPSTSGARQ